EVAIRFKNRSASGKRVLVWDAFFSTKAEDDASVKYSLNHLLKMSHEEMKAIFEEYFYRVYFQNYQENGMTMADVYDPQLLSLLGLPAYASMKEVKSRFRQLAMCYHPDRGGDSAKFIELVEIYEKLKGEQE